MALIAADRVRDVTTTTGTGPFTVSGSAPVAYRTFSAVMSVNDTFFGLIQHQTLNEWVVGLFTYSASNQITVTSIFSSSNAGSAVTFSAGTKDIVLTQTAERFVLLAETDALQCVRILGNTNPSNEWDAIYVGNNGTAATNLILEGAGGAKFQLTGGSECSVYGINSPLNFFSTGSNEIRFNAGASGLENIKCYVSPKTVNIGGYRAPVEGYQTFQITNNSDDWLFNGTTFGANPYGSNFQFAKTRGADPNTHGALNNGDQIYGTYVFGSDGSGWVNGAYIASYVDGAVSTGVVPTNVVISTGTAVGGTLRLRITSNGRIEFGDGSLVVPSGFGVGATKTQSVSTKSITAVSGDPSPGVNAAHMWYIESLGDNTNYIGAAAGWFVAADKSSVASGTKGVLNALNIAVVPLIARNNSPVDDVVGLGIYNNGTVPGTDAIYLGRESFGSPDTKDWDGAILEVGAYASNGVSLSGRYDRAFKVNNQPAEAYFLGGVSTAFNDVSVGDGPYFQIHGNESSPSSAMFARWTNDAFGNRIWLVKSRSTTFGNANGIVQNADTGGQIAFGFDDGTQIVPGAYIAAVVDGTPGANDMPTKLDFRVSADGSASPTTRFTIKPIGSLLHNGLIFNEVRNLTSNHTLASATATSVTDLKFSALPVGTYVVTYYLVVQSSAVGTGIGTGINFTGTLSQIVTVRREATTATSAATGVIDDVANILTGSYYEARATKNLTTTSPDMLNTGVATANSNCMIIIETIFTVSAQGDLELWHSSETANNTSIMAGSAAVLNQIS